MNNHRVMNLTAANVTGHDAPAIVRGEKVWLRAFEAEDLDAYQKAVNDGEIAYWSGFQQPRSTEEIKRWYEDEVLSGKVLLFAIAPIGGTNFIGAAWLEDIEEPPGNARCNLFISDKARWNNGVGSDAINVLTDFVFGSLSLHRLWLTVETDNQRAQRAFEKAGFVAEGTLRSHVRRRGRLSDSVLMAILLSDWEALTRPRSWDYQELP